MAKAERLLAWESQAVSFVPADILDDLKKPFSLFQRCSFWSVTAGSTFRAVRYSCPISQLLHTSPLHSQNWMQDSKVAATTPVCCAECSHRLPMGAAQSSPHTSASPWLSRQKSSLAGEKPVRRPRTSGLLYQITSEYLLEGADTRFSLIFLSQRPHPKDPALSPPGNPSGMHPPLSTQPQETAAGKRQSPSHEANGKLTAEFSIRKTPKVLMLEREEGSTL